MNKGQPELLIPSDEVKSSKPQKNSGLAALGESGRGCESESE